MRAPPIRRGQQREAPLVSVTVFIAWLQQLEGSSRGPWLLDLSVLDPGLKPGSKSKMDVFISCSSTRFVTAQAMVKIVLMMHY